MDENMHPGLCKNRISSISLLNSKNSAKAIISKIMACLFRMRSEKRI